MTPFYSDDWLTILQGDVREVLPTLPAESVDCIVTSPPFWGLRDYGHADQIGLERTPEEYVANMVGVFRELRRVLKASGTCWLNLGDSFASNGTPGRSNLDELGEQYRGGGHKRSEVTKPRRQLGGLKPKDLVGIPWRVAFALQADGWYLRSDIIWAKPNPMPESVTDRPTKSHEYLFLLSKSPRYYFDADAVREPNTSSEQAAHNERYAKVYDAHSLNVENGAKQPGNVGSLGIHARPGPGGRNLRSVWTIDYDYNEVEWIGAIGSCRRCGGLRVAGNGSAPTMSKATDDSRDRQDSDRRSSGPTVSPTRSLWEPSDPDSPSTTSVAIEDASTPTTLIPSPSGSTSTEETRQPPATPPRLDAPKDTSTARRTLTDALTESGSAVCVCATEPAGVGRLSDVWTVATRPYPGAHFAVFPPELPERCIKAGSSERGVCPECGAPWERVVERSLLNTEGWGRATKDHHADVQGSDALTRNGQGRAGDSVVNTIGWRPTCRHETLKPIGAVVLDPFAGSGTTGMVANRLSRRAILIDLNGDYLKQQLQRNAQTPLGLGAA